MVLTFQYWVGARAIRMQAAEPYGLGSISSTLAPTQRHCGAAEPYSLGSISSTLAPTQRHCLCV
jgi:hypothetical protein